MPGHTHRIPYISFVLRGGYREKVGRSVRECVPDTVVFHQADETHAVDFRRTETRILRIEPDQSWFDQNDTFPEIFENPEPFSHDPISWIAARLYFEFKKNDDFSRLAIQGLMLEMLAEAGRRQTGKREKERKPVWLKKTIEILREDFNEKTSLGKLAAEAGVHPVYLSREFRRRMGLTIGEFVRRKRIETACRAMEKDDRELSEIAGSVGFYDQSHFTNTFKRLTGLTPSEYRSAFRPG